MSSTIKELGEKSMRRDWIGHLCQASAISALYCALLPFSVSATPSGGDIFKNNCAACHASGGNIVDPKKPLKGSKKLANKEMFKDLLSKPAGAMPAFPKIVEDDPSLSALYDYCKSLK
jgi:mono/diheme cytochrome c family protein